MNALRKNSVSKKRALHWFALCDSSDTPFHFVQRTTLEDAVSAAESFPSVPGHYHHYHVRQVRKPSAKWVRNRIETLNRLVKVGKPDLVKSRKKEIAQMKKLLP